MSLKNMSEMSRLIWSFTVPVLLLAAIIIGFFLVNGITSANNNARHFKEMMIQQTAQSYQRAGANFQNVNFNPWKIFNPEIMNSTLRGDMGPLYKLMKEMSFLTTPAEYTGVIIDGKLSDYSVKPKVEIDPDKLPTSPPPGDYKIFNSLGSRRGTFMNVFYPVDLGMVGVRSKVYLTSVYDLTKQVKDIDSYFNDQKKYTYIKLIITAVIAFILFGLLSTFWLRHLVKIHVARPVEKLNTMAEDIVAGTFEGEVVVDHGSDFAALQGLLKSGQLILRKLDERMDEED